MDWDKVFVLIEERDKENSHKKRYNVREIQPVLYMSKALEKPVRCDSCDGKGSYLMPANLHESEGWVPCNHCYKGWRNTETVVAVKPVYRVRSRPID